MLKRGLSQRIVWAYNPLPDVKDEEVLARAGMDIATPSVESPFRLHWQYSGGLEREDIFLNPGEAHPLRESESREIYRDMYTMGLVLLERNDAEERREKTLEGLRRALTYWRDRGAVKIQDFRKLHGIGEAETQDHKYELLYPAFIAKAKTEIIEETIRALTAPPARPAKSATQSAATA